MQITQLATPNGHAEAARAVGEQGPSQGDDRSASGQQRDATRCQIEWILTDITSGECEENRLKRNKRSESVPANPPREERVEGSPLLFADVLSRRESDIPLVAECGECAPLPAGEGEV